MTRPMLPVKSGVAIAQNTPKYLSNMLVNQNLKVQASAWEEKHLRRSWCNWCLWQRKEDYDLKGDLKLVMFLWGLIKTEPSSELITRKVKQRRKLK